MKEIDTLKDGGVKCHACGKVYEHESQWNCLSLPDLFQGGQFGMKDGSLYGHRQNRICLCGKPVHRTVTIYRDK